MCVCVCVFMMNVEGNLMHFEGNLTYTYINIMC